MDTEQSSNKSILTLEDWRYMIITGSQKQCNIEEKDKKLELIYNIIKLAMEYPEYWVYCGKSFIKFTKKKVCLLMNYDNKYMARKKFVKWIDQINIMTGEKPQCLVRKRKQIEEIDYQSDLSVNFCSRKVLKCGQRCYQHQKIRDDRKEVIENYIKSGPDVAGLVCDYMDL